MLGPFIGQGPAEESVDLIMKNGELLMEGRRMKWLGAEYEKIQV
jgi:hypothetical protein